MVDGEDEVDVDTAGTAHTSLLSAIYERRANMTMYEAPSEKRKKRPILLDQGIWRGHRVIPGRSSIIRKSEIALSTMGATVED